MAGTLHTQEYKKLIKALVDARKAMGMSQAEVATVLGKPPSFVAKVELCERRLDVIEFCSFLAAVSQEPKTFLCTHVSFNSKIPV